MFGFSESRVQVMLGSKYDILYCNFQESLWKTGKEEYESLKIWVGTIKC